MSLVRISRPLVSRSSRPTGNTQASEIGNQVVDGRTAFRIFVSGQVALRFVQKQIDLFLLLDRLTVERDLVAFQIDPVIGGLNLAAVHGDASRADPAARFGAGAEARFRKHAVERLEFFLAYL